MQMFAFWSHSCFANTIYVFVLYTANLFDILNKKMQCELLQFGEIWHKHKFIAGDDNSSFHKKWITLYYLYVIYFIDIPVSQTAGFKNNHDWSVHYRSLNSLKAV